MTPPARLGRAMGTFSSIQTAGMVFAPLVGGAAGAIDYRLAFVVPAGVALVLAAVPLPARGRAEQPPTLRSAITRRTALLSGFAFLGYMSTLGVGFLVALRAADAFGVSAGTRGLLLASFGLAGVLSGRPIGELVDRFGPVRVLVAGTAACAVVVPLVGLAGSAVLLALTWMLAGFASQMLWGTVYTLAVSASPHNRAGAVSIVGACRFAGNAMAPLLWLPLYHVEDWLPFAASGAVMALMAAGSRRFR
jgi:MFS family permease